MPIGNASLVMYIFNNDLCFHLMRHVLLIYFLKWFSKLTKNICIVIFLYDIRFDINDATRMLFVICLAKSVKSLMKMIMFPTFRKLRLESTFMKIYKWYFFNCIFFKKTNLCTEVIIFTDNLYFIPLFTWFISKLSLISTLL